MENSNPTTTKRGSKHAVTRQNREHVKAAVRSLRQAFPDWSTTRIAANLGIGETTVRSMLEPDDAPKRSHKKKQPDTVCQLSIDETEEQPDFPDFPSTPSIPDLPSREYGTATQTASIIAERDAIADMKIAAHELMCGARKLEETLGQMDALLKAAFVKGAMAAQNIQGIQGIQD